MQNTVVKENYKPQTKNQQKDFTWIDNPGIQRLLDVISSIIANEYIKVAKQNPDIFKNDGGKK